MWTDYVRLRQTLHCRALVIAVRLVCGLGGGLVLLAPSWVSAQTRYLSIDHIGAGDTHAIEVFATDSGVVSVRVVGGKYPLVAQASSAEARRWAAETDAAARDGSDATAHERHEFGYLSDILRFQRVTNGAGQQRDVIAVDIGPRNLSMYEHDMPLPMIQRLTGSMRRAASMTDSLGKQRPKRSLSPPTVNHSTVSHPMAASQPGNVATSAAERCYMASGMHPIEYSAYPAGTNLDKVIQPPLQPGSVVPAYPRSALGARVIGEVSARFVIDTEGRPDVETFRLRGVVNPLFVQSVCDALPRMRFIPARLNGRLVKQLVDETFTIAPPSGTR